MATSERLVEGGGYAMAPDVLCRKTMLRKLRALIARDIEGRDIGHLVELPVAAVLPDRGYGDLSDFLRLFEGSLLTFIVKHRGTAYYRKQRGRLGVLRAYWRIYRYYRIFRNIKDNGYDVSKSSPVVIFATREFYFRFDGTHRSSILRYLNYKTCPTLLITPKDVQGHVCQLLDGLDEPTTSGDIRDTIGV